MLHRQGFTLIEMIIVLVIIAIAAVFSFPNFTTPTEQARASNAWNNLLAMYSAQQNYRNNNSGNFAAASSLALIDSALSLTIQDDGTYLYACSLGPPPVCTANRNVVPSTLGITLTLNIPIQSGNVNPQCSSATGNSNWCP